MLLRWRSPKLKAVLSRTHLTVRINIPNLLNLLKYTKLEEFVKVQKGG